MNRSPRSGDPADSRHRVLVVDDEASIADIVSEALRLCGHDVTIASTGVEALRWARAGRFDLVVLDVMLPDYDGFEVCRRMRAEGIEVPVLFLTARARPADATRGLTLGGDDYVRKPFDIDELVARAQALLRRAKPGTAHVLRIADVQVDLLRYEARRGGRPLDLSRTEFRLLEVLVLHARRILTKHQLVELVWDDPAARELATVETVVSRLRRKLDAFGPSLVHTRRGVGYGIFDAEVRA